MDRSELGWIVVGAACLYGGWKYWKAQTGCLDSPYEETLALSEPTTIGCGAAEATLTNYTNPTEVLVTCSKESRRLLLYGSQVSSEACDVQIQLVKSFKDGEVQRPSAEVLVYYASE